MKTEPATPTDNEALREELVKQIERWAPTSSEDIASDIMKLIACHTQAARQTDLTPDTLLLEQNKRLIEAGDALYERASYTGRTFDGTHRLLSAAANWLDVRGKNSGQYQAELKAARPGSEEQS